MKINILVIDDTLHVLEVMRDILEMEGFNVLTASNVIDGLKMISRKAPNLIISDLKMPEMTGFDFLEKMKSLENYNKIPIIILSANTDEHKIKEALKLNASAYLKKPCSAEELIETINRVLN